MLLDTREILSKGEIAIPKGEGLKRITISNGLFPVLWDPTYCQYGGPTLPDGSTPSGRFLPSPKQFCVPKIDYLKKHRIVCRMVLGIWPVSWPMMITSFSAREVGGEIDDVYFDLTFTEAVQVGLRTKDQSPLLGANEIVPAAFDDATAAPPAEVPVTGRLDTRNSVRSWITGVVGYDLDGNPVGEQLWEMAQLISYENRQFTIEDLLAANNDPKFPAYEFIAQGLPIPSGTTIYLPQYAATPYDLSPELGRAGPA